MPLTKHLKTKQNTYDLKKLLKNFLAGLWIFSKSKYSKPSLEKIVLENYLKFLSDDLTDNFSSAGSRDITLIYTSLGHKIFHLSKNYWHDQKITIKKTIMLFLHIHFG